MVDICLSNMKVSFTTGFDVYVIGINFMHVGYGKLALCTAVRRHDDAC